jgi:hypothetical protein
MTEIRYNDKKVVLMEVHDSGEFIWLKFITKDGKTFTTFNFKGEV